MLKPLVKDKPFLLLVFVLTLLEFVRGAIIISYLPSLASSQLISLTFIGLAITLHFVSDAVTNIGIGFFMKRLGVKLVMHSCFFLMVVSVSLFFLVPSNGLMIFAAIVLGLGICPLWLVVLTKASGENRGKNMGFVYFGWLFGIATGTISMNVISTLQVDLLGFFVPLLLLLAWFIYSRSDTQKVEIKQMNMKTEWQGLVQFVKKSKIVIPGVLLQGMAMGMLIPILPSFAIEELHLTEPQYVVMLVVGGLCAIVFLIPMGRWVDIVNIRIPIILGFSVFALFLYLLTTSDTLLFTTICVIAIGIFYAMLLPAWNSFLADFIPSYIKEASWGLVSSLQGIGVMVGPIVGSLLALGKNTEVTITISALLLGLTALFYFGYFSVFARIRS
ncbi:MFS transporter [Alkalihalobacillus sp. LMS39]|uniref:MFS transporter n=1 Tax=Alkalihalobacillus sp. LMS39 TaxID=2924032 RepID=UPI001FB1D03E|nr:MFS transporter [Alkalihalobacillus sp. LMS39]UOE93549.1 MFS transporter [Alkalihalobacillus sp. LMS39]